MSVDGIARILEEYDEKCELYRAYSRRLHVLIGELLEVNDINIVSVTYRLKDKDKLEKKIKKGEDQYTCLEDITDVSGLRIITYFADDVDRVAEIIESEFEIDRENSVDKRDIMKSNQFGYMSLHYVMSLPESRLSHSENERFRGCKAEIQIRSVLQHAWAEIEHDLGYKTELEIPQQTRRRFTRIAGLLEVADSEFDTIRLSLAKYREEIGRRIIEEPTQVMIDKDSLIYFMKTDPIFESITMEIAQKLGREDDFMDYVGGNYVDELIEFGIGTISELRKKIEESRALIVAFAVDWLSRELDEEEPDIPPTIIGGYLVIHYLIYILIGESGKTEFTMSYLRKRFSFSDDDSFTNRVFLTYQRLTQR